MEELTGGREERRRRTPTALAAAADRGGHRLRSGKERERQGERRRHKRTAAPAPPPPRACFGDEVGPARGAQPGGGEEVGGVVGDGVFLGHDLSPVRDANEQMPLRFRYSLLELV
jgi:hypothetical protein